jgi:effector-binding domain-containing protein
VWNVVKSQKVPGAGRHVALYWDCVMNIEVGVEVEAPLAGYGEVVGSALPAGTVVTTAHFGPYQLLGGAHQAVHDWCTQNGKEFAGPSWEIYGHWLDEWNNDPSKIRTDIYYLLKDSA